MIEKYGIGYVEEITAGLNARELKLMSQIIALGSCEERARAIAKKFKGSFVRAWAGVPLREIEWVVIEMCVQDYGLETTPWEESRAELKTLYVETDLITSPLPAHDWREVFPCPGQAAWDEHMTELAWQYQSLERGKAWDSMEVILKCLGEWAPDPEPIV